MPRILIDNTPAVASFNDGDPMSNGAKNLATALIEAPQQAAQIRAQQQAAQMAQLWKQKEFDRATQNDQMQALWHDQANDLGNRQLQSIDDQRKAEGSLHLEESAGRGAMNIAHLIAGIFGGPNGGKPPITQDEAWGHAVRIAQAEAPKDEITGQPLAVKPARVQELFQGILSGHIPIPMEQAPQIVPQAAPAPAPAAPDHWWNHVFDQPNPSPVSHPQISGDEFSVGGDEPPPAPAPAPGGKVIPRAIRIQKAQKAGITPEAAAQHYQQLGFQIGN